MDALSRIIDDCQPPAQERIDFFRRLLDANGLDECLAVVGELIKGVGAIDGYLFNFLDEERLALVCEHIVLPPEFESVRSTYWKLRFPLEDDDETVRCFSQCVVISADPGDVAQLHGATRARLERWRMRSLVFVPLFCGGECVGTLMIFSQREVIEAPQIECVRKILEMAESAIGRARRFSTLAEGKAKFLRSAEEREQLIDFFSEAGSLAVDDTFYQRLMERLLRYFGFDFVILFLLENDRLGPRAGETLNPDLRAPVEDFMRACPLYELNLTSAAMPFAVLKRMTLHFPDVQAVMNLPMSDLDRDWLDYLSARGYPLRTLMHVPLIAGTRAVGSMGCYSVLKLMNLDREQLALIDLLARFFASAIEGRHLCQQVERLGEKLLDQTMHDPLTGLYNFGHLQEELERRILERQREQVERHSPLSVIIMDIDHFKAFNDSFGHLAGNRALVEISNRVATLVRRMDIVCRYGGEEFFVILPNCGVDGAHGLAERIRQAVETQPVHFDGGKASVTISLGVAEYDGTESAGGLIGRADVALYAAKAGGRNRTEVAHV